MHVNLHWNLCIEILCYNQMVHALDKLTNKMDETLELEEFQKDLNTMAFKIMQNARTKILKYVVVMDPKLGTDQIETLMNIVLDCLSMESRKEVGLDKFQVIGIMRFQNPIWDALLRGFFTANEGVLRDFPYF